MKAMSVGHFNGYMGNAQFAHAPCHVTGCYGSYKTRYL